MAAKTILNRKHESRLDDWSPQLLKSRLYAQLLVDIIIGRLAPGERLDEQALAWPESARPWRGWRWRAWC
jgi:hypothetical protein